MLIGTSSLRSRPSRSFLSVLLTGILVMATFSTPGYSQTQQAEGKRPMNWMEVQLMKRAGSWAPSPDGNWMLYTVTTPDWKDADSQTDIHLVSLREGVSSNRQMTFTGGHNESSPTWGPDGSFFLFVSNREADGGTRGSQLYLMRPDGGEARKITDVSDGVSGFEFNPDGQWLVYRSGPSGQQQLFRLPVDEIVDSGRTLDGVVGALRARGAAEVVTCVLLDKEARREVDIRPDHRGFAIADEFVVGYGLDYAGEYRNLPYIAVLREECVHASSDVDGRD